MYQSASTFIASNTQELLSALDQTAALRQNGIRQPIRILLREGTYCLSQTIRLNPNHSALTIEPYGSEKVRIVGGKRITGFVRDTFNGRPCISALVPEVKDGSFDFSDFYVDGRRADWTRYPSDAWLTPAGCEVPDTDGLHDGSHWIKIDPDKLKNLVYDEYTVLSINHLWIDEHSEITSLDPETGRIDLRYPTNFRIGDSIIRLENLPSAFEKPNQWYLDHHSGKVYYLPNDPSQSPDSIEAYAPVLEQLFTIEGENAQNTADNVNLRSLALCVTRGDRFTPEFIRTHEKLTAANSQAASDADGAIRFAYARGCSVRDCDLTCYGCYGAFVSGGCHDIRFENCLFFDGGAGGVRVNGEPVTGNPDAFTSHVSVSDCVIEHCDRRYQAGVGVLIMHASSCEVTHCDIHDLYYSGVSAGWTWGYKPTNTAFTRITDNRIWDIGQGILSDMGGVYLLGQQEGTIVARNLIHDVFAREYGGWALYTDEGSARVTMEDNLCYHTFDYVYHQHYGTMNTIRNNIFAFGGKGVLRVTRPEEHLSIIFDTNILYSDDKPIFTGEPNGKHLTDHRVAIKGGIAYVEKKPPFVYNELHETEAEAISYDDCVASGLFENVTVADPGFRDPAHFDFTLPDDSPAYATGFRKLDLSQVGPRMSRRIPD